MGTCKFAPHSNRWTSEKYVCVQYQCSVNVMYVFVFSLLVIYSRFQVFYAWSAQWKVRCSRTSCGSAAVLATSFLERKKIPLPLRRNVVYLIFTNLDLYLLLEQISPYRCITTRGVAGVLGRGVHDRIPTRINVMSITICNKTSKPQSPVYWNVYNRHSFGRTQCSNVLSEYCCSYCCSVGYCRVSFRI